MNSLHSMTTDQIVEEIGEIRTNLEGSAFRLIALTKVLYAKSRKEASDSTPVYVAYSNAWMRFAGSMHQGLRRVNSANRIVESFKKEAQEKAQAEEAKRRKAEKPVISLSKARENAFSDYEELYGEEFLQNEVG